MTWISGNRSLTQAEMENNANIFYNVMSGYGFSLNAIAGMLGNIQAESRVNPGAWESYKPFSGGYGLVQWTPYTNYADWAGSGWEDNGDKECERINYEFANGLQYYPTSSYPMSASEFKTSEQSPGYLAYAFMYNYERPKNKNQPLRKKYANNWYTFLSGQPVPTPPDPDPPEPP